MIKFEYKVTECEVECCYVFGFERGSASIVRAVVRLMGLIGQVIQPRDGNTTFLNERQKETILLKSLPYFKLLFWVFY